MRERALGVSPLLLRDRDRSVDLPFAPPELLAFRRERLDLDVEHIERSRRGRLAADLGELGAEPCAGRLA